MMGIIEEIHLGEGGWNFERPGQRLEEKLIYHERKWGIIWVQVTQCAGPSCIPIAEGNGDNIFQSP